MLNAFLITIFLAETYAHLGAWHKGMYCKKGTSGRDDKNTNTVVQPMKGTQWWFQHWNGCDQFPPDEGDFLELPAKGTFTIEHAVNRRFTTTIDDAILGEFVDGKDHPHFGISDDGKIPGSKCITEPNMHTQNESMAHGTAFAISYTSDLSKVTPENLVVFTVLYNTPWKRLATYHVPDLASCPPAGCICAWGWIPGGCGASNMYMQGFRCKVFNSNSTRTLSPAQPPVWCEEDEESCKQGAKQMIFWHQLDGNNVQVSGYNKFGFPKFPGYNMKMGFRNGAQNDIFLS